MREEEEELVCERAATGESTAFFLLGMVEGAATLT
jgi:hypothetical protein